MSTSKLLSGRVCLVTGASRGIGRGIALQLGQAGSLVYITGRSAEALGKTGAEIKARGGEAIPVIMDHANDKEVEALFQRINKEQNGKLDVLVNNAYAGVNTITQSMGKKFYETPAEETWDTINGVGLRNHYLCSVHAARIMVPRSNGLIINVSSGGGLVYLFNVAYGVGKAALDRMSADTAHELKKKGVTVISLWPGPVKTELICAEMEKGTDDPLKKKGMAIFEDGESVEFAGKAVVHLAADENVHKKTGRIQMTADLAREYGFTDDDGLIHGEMRSVSRALANAGWTTTASFIPGWIRVPTQLMHYLSYKF